ncbi:hypothetical protein [Streptomyces longwoodensis]|uniref:hypothetical protein n=1 Tax=Streptomyces longwoodensis TaxID=68231 RepID=UPI0034033F7C
MADGDFYTRDRPDHATLPEDRPRGGGPEDSPRRRTKPVWLVLLLVVVIAILLAIFLP